MFLEDAYCAFLLISLLLLAATSLLPILLYRSLCLCLTAPSFYTRSLLPFMFDRSFPSYLGRSFPPAQSKILHGIHPQVPSSAPASDPSCYLPLPSTVHSLSPSRSQYIDTQSLLLLLYFLSSFHSPILHPELLHLFPIP